MTDWEFEHTIYTKAKRKDAWDFWSDFDNHARMEPGVKRIELDGPVETGTTGRTITEDYTQEWKLTEVIEQERIVITGHSPDGMLIFTWNFEDEGNGTRLTQSIEATESLVEQYPDEFRQMEKHVPGAMARLSEELDRLTNE